MTASATDSIQVMRHEEALRHARKRVKDIRAFYVSATTYCIVIPCLWALNLIARGNIWAHWATIGFASRSFFGNEWEERKFDEIMASEKQLMQAQIEPHFLFNTLATIRSLISRSPEKANLMMDNFIAYLRQSLSASRAQEGTIKQKFDLLRHYLELFKIRMGDRGLPRYQNARTIGCRSRATNGRQHSRGVRHRLRPIRGAGV